MPCFLFLFLSNETLWFFPDCCWSITQSCAILCDTMDCSTPGFPVLHYLLEFAQTHVRWVDDAVQPSVLCCPLLFLLSVFPSMKIFSSESNLCNKWPKYSSLSFSISPSNECSVLISFSFDWLNSLLFKGLSRVFSNTTVQKHQFFSAQSSLWSNSHIYTWLLEKS